MDTRRESRRELREDRDHKQEQIERLSQELVELSQSRERDRERANVAEFNLRGLADTVKALERRIAGDAPPPGAQGSYRCETCKDEGEIEGIFATWEGHPVSSVVCPTCLGKPGGLPPL